MNTGIILKSQKKYDDAVSEFQRIIYEIPSTEEDEKLQKTLASAKQQVINCYILKSYDFYEKQQFDDALINLEQAESFAKLYDDHSSQQVIANAMPRMVFAKGINVMETNNFEEAITYFNKSIELNPNQSNVWLATGAAYQKLGNVEKMLESYENAINAAAAQNRPADAAEARKAAVSCLFAAGQEAKHQKYYDGAYKYFAMVTKFDEKNTEGYLQMAIVSNFNKKYKDAITVASQGLAIEKRVLQSAQLAYQLAFAYEQNTIPNPEKACEYYQKAAVTNDNAIKQNSKDAIRRLRCGK